MDLPSKKNMDHLVLPKPLAYVYSPNNLSFHLEQLFGFEAKGWNAGVNYFFSENAAKIQASYGMYQNVTGGMGTYSQAGMDTDVDAKVGVLAFSMSL